MSLFTKGGRRERVDIMRDPGLPGIVGGVRSKDGDNDDGHVITADTSELSVLGETSIHHTLADLLEGEVSGQTATDKLNDILIGHAIPDAITGQDDELILGKVEGVLDDIGVRSDDLLFGAENLVVLELKVP